MTNFLSTAKITKSVIAELQTKQICWRNELVYLMPTREAEKQQGREFTSRISRLMEELEMNGSPKLLPIIEALSNDLTFGLTKFA